MSSLTAETALRQQLRQHRQQLDLLTNTFTAADLRLVLVDSLQKLDALQVNEGEKKTSNVGSNAGGPQPKTMEELREWLEEYCKGVKNYGEPNTWDVTLVTDMSCLFENLEKFNAPIDQWNTSEVTDMSSMFEGATSFNQPITMDTSKVTDMSSMFEGATSFNQPITMDTLKVTDMSRMFHSASSFNQPLTMDTSKVTDMDYMFLGAKAMTYPKPSL